ncbi:MAG: hypothetical protein II968_00355 [Selenomonadaceae bacterium]|nr:hypothetical protein [Selenomonadaceae bacterium]MBR0261590.1 hypothetical protein [Selenomonadaceae bacterium]
MNSAVQENISSTGWPDYPSRITLRTFDELIAALFKWWAKDCLQLNEDNIGFESPTASVKDVGLYFYDDTINANLFICPSGTKRQYDKIITTEFPLLT